MKNCFFVGPFLVVLQEFCHSKATGLSLQSTKVYAIHCHILQYTAVLYLIDISYLSNFLEFTAIHCNITSRSLHHLSVQYH